jgi:hypothetical protein
LVDFFSKSCQKAIELDFKEIYKSKPGVYPKDNKKYPISTSIISLFLILNKFLDETMNLYMEDFMLIYISTSKATLQFYIESTIQNIEIFYKNLINKITEFENKKKKKRNNNTLIEDYMNNINENSNNNENNNNNNDNNIEEEEILDIQIENLWLQSYINSVTISQEKLLEW